MLSKEDNEALTSVGPGTLMGGLMREYWLPFMYGWELEPDGAPLRVRLLGEDLVAFRDTNGRVGLVDAHCAHRGASLFFGRNEECGLRCVYHGWKYDVDGNCVDMPNEPELFTGDQAGADAHDESIPMGAAPRRFKDKIHHTAYRCGEQGGVVFAYMGSRQADPPRLPELEWGLLPETQVHHEYKAVYQCNWMQALEGDLDTAHVFFLHSRLRQEDGKAAGAYHPDRSPKLEVVETDYGLMYGARRVHSPGQIYWRTTQFLMPVYTLFPAYEDGIVPVHIWVPIDDDHTLVWGVKWHPAQEIPERQLLTRSELIAGVGPMKEEQKGTFYAQWWPQASMENDFLLDREVQRTQTFTGIPAIRLQDASMTTSMGTIMNRTQEHLGTTDTAIIRARQRLIRAARALREDGTLPPAADRPELYRVRSCSALLPEGVDWQTALDDWHHARTTEVSAAQASAGRT